MASKWIEVDRGTGLGLNDTTRRVKVRLAFGWRVEAWWSNAHRLRLGVLGVGVYLGEPWGVEGALWGFVVRLWTLSIGAGLRGPEREGWFVEDDDFDPEPSDA